MLDLKMLPAQSNNASNISHMAQVIVNNNLCAHKGQEKKRGERKRVVPNQESRSLHSFIAPFNYSTKDSDLICFDLMVCLHLFKQ